MIEKKSIVIVYSHVTQKYWIEILVFWKNVSQSDKYIFRGVSHDTSWNSGQYRWLYLL